MRSGGSQAGSGKNLAPIGRGSGFRPRWVESRSGSSPVARIGNSEGLAGGSHYSEGGSRLRWLSSTFRMPLEIA